VDLLVFFKTINYSGYLAHIFNKNSRLRAAHYSVVLLRTLTKFIFLLSRAEFYSNKIGADQLPPRKMEFWLISPLQGVS
jgi:hypothetical protein